MYVGYIKKNQREKQSKEAKELGKKAKMQAKTKKNIKG
jgi:hypothetical protein